MSTSRTSAQNGYFGLQPLFCYGDFEPQPLTLFIGGPTPTKISDMPGNQGSLLSSTLVSMRTGIERENHFVDEQWNTQSQGTAIEGDYSLQVCPTYQPCDGGVQEQRVTPLQGQTQRYYQPGHKWFQDLTGNSQKGLTTGFYGDLASRYESTPGVTTQVRVFDTRRFTGWEFFGTKLTYSTYSYVPPTPPTVCGTYDRTQAEVVVPMYCSGYTHTASSSHYSSSRTESASVNFQVVDEYPCLLIGNVSIQDFSSTQNPPQCQSYANDTITFQGDGLDNNQAIRSLVDDLHASGSPNFVVVRYTIVRSKTYETTGGVTTPFWLDSLQINGNLTHLHSHADPGMQTPLFASFSGTDAYSHGNAVQLVSLQLPLDSVSAQNPPTGMEVSVWGNTRSVLGKEAQLSSRMPKDGVTTYVNFKEGTSSSWPSPTAESEAWEAGDHPAGTQQLLRGYGVFRPLQLQVTKIQNGNGEWSVSAPGNTQVWVRVKNTTKIKLDITLGGQDNVSGTTTTLEPGATSGSWLAVAEKPGATYGRSTVTVKDNLRPDRKVGGEPLALEIYAAYKQDYDLERTGDADPESQAGRERRTDKGGLEDAAFGCLPQETFQKDETSTMTTTVLNYRQRDNALVVEPPSVDGQLYEVLADPQVTGLGETLGQGHQFQLTNLDYCSSKDVLVAWDENTACKEWDIPVTQQLGEHPQRTELSATMNRKVQTTVERYSYQDMIDKLKLLLPPRPNKPTQTNLQQNQGAWQIGNCRLDLGIAYPDNPPDEANEVRCFVRKAKVVQNAST